MDLPILNVSYKWNLTHGLLWLPSVSEHNVFKVHPCHSMCECITHFYSFISEKKLPLLSLGFSCKFQCWSFPAVASSCSWRPSDRSWNSCSFHSRFLSRLWPEMSRVVCSQLYQEEWQPNAHRRMQWHLLPGRQSACTSSLLAGRISISDISKEPQQAKEMIKQSKYKMGFKRIKRRKTSSTKSSIRISTRHKNNIGKAVRGVLGVTKWTIITK